MSRQDPIFSTDPEAVVKLYMELAECKEQQEWMVKVNKVVRAYRKKDDIEGGVAALVTMGQKEAWARSMFKPDFCGRYGYPNYELANNNQNMARIKERIARLSKEKDTWAETR